MAARRRVTEPSKRHFIVYVLLSTVVCCKFVFYVVFIDRVRDYGQSPY